MALEYNLSSVTVLLRNTTALKSLLKFHMNFTTMFLCYIKSLWIVIASADIPVTQHFPVEFYLPKAQQCFPLSGGFYSSSLHKSNALVHYYSFVFPFETTVNGISKYLWGFFSCLWVTSFV